MPAADMNILRIVESVSKYIIMLVKRLFLPSQRYKIIVYYVCICVYVLPTINCSIGVVEYNVDGFVERNKDVFNNDLIELMQTSTNNLIQKLFPDVIDRDNRKRPPTAGSKIKKQVIKLNKSI